jgi:hypothetical protein
MPHLLDIDCFNKSFPDHFKLVIQKKKSLILIRDPREANHKEMLNVVVDEFYTTKKSMPLCQDARE